MLANTRKILADLWSVSYEFMVSPICLFYPSHPLPCFQPSYIPSLRHRLIWNSRPSLLSCAGITGALLRQPGHLCLGAKGSSRSCGWRGSLGMFCEVECLQGVQLSHSLCFSALWLIRHCCFALICWLRIVEANPRKFNLDATELSIRKAFITSTRQIVRVRSTPCCVVSARDRHTGQKPPSATAQQADSQTT